MWRLFCPDIRWWAFGHDEVKLLITKTNHWKFTGLLAMDSYQYLLKLRCGILWVFVLQSLMLPGAQSFLCCVWKECLLSVKWAFTLPRRKFHTLSDLEQGSILPRERLLLLVKCWEGLSATHPLAKCAKEVHPGSCKFPATETENSIFPDYDLLARMKKSLNLCPCVEGKSPTWSVSCLQASEILKKPVL